MALTGVRAEFRTALLKEIEEAERNPTRNAVSLWNGRRIGDLGGAFQYVFGLENVLNTPADTPGELRGIPGRLPLPVDVIRFEGLTVTLRVPEDLGAFVPVAQLVASLTFLLRKLITRIEALGDDPNPAGERARGALPPRGETVALDPEDSGDLNHEQQAAVASCLGRDTTFVWGPPGTGKTKTIGAMGRALHRRGRSLLLVSHTNAAVDQALAEIGDGVDASDLAAGRVVRVGDPVDPRLLAEAKRELRLSTHVDRRAAALSARRDELLAERGVSERELAGICRLIDISEWVNEASRDLDQFGGQLEGIHGLELQLQEVMADRECLSASAGSWQRATDAARGALRDHARLGELMAKAVSCEDALSEFRERRDNAARAHQEAMELLMRARSLEPQRARLRKLPSEAVQREAVAVARATEALASRESSDATARLLSEQSVLNESVSKGRLARLWRQLPDPEKQAQLVERLKREVDEAVAKHSTVSAAARRAESTLGAVQEVQAALEPHRSVPQPAHQEAVALSRKTALSQLDTAVAVHELMLTRLRAEASGVAERTDGFAREYGRSPQAVLDEGLAHAVALAAEGERVRVLSRESAGARRVLEERLRTCLAVLGGWFEVSAADPHAETMLDEVRRVHAEAAVEVGGLPLDALRAERSAMNERIALIESEVAEIADALKRVEEDIIAAASIVATTLTRAYLRDSIQGRRFDTVILDEASIAPVPALWVAASLADRNVVVVGDPRQLPPIVTSKHKLAQEWLGKDIFAHAGVCDDSAAEHVVALCWQYRMHPDISSIANSLVYDGRLRDDPRSFHDDDNLRTWYAGHDDAVLLADTGPVGAWVTSVPRGEGASRLNFLSATICVDLAESYLREGRVPKSAEERHRILIVCPYRAHAKLLGLLIREHGLDGEVVAGTAHHFQGSEAGVVIFDLVNDEPHWRVGLFTPGHDPGSIPLLNVALTRARRRLVVVGDFGYIKKMGGKAFLGGKLVPLLERQGRRVSALDLVPAGLAARASRAQGAATGEVEPEAARSIVNQDGFYQMLGHDLARARSRVVIYSPFMAPQRLAMMEPHLRALTERGAATYVVTKDLSERGSQSWSYRSMEEALSSWGVVVVHKRGMHEKLVFVDGGILWSGSLNPLSHSSTQEIMERRASPKVVEDYARTLCLDGLVRRYHDGTPTCPQGHELVAAEGRTEPFYWRCVEDGCFTCNIDEEFGQDGTILCAHAGCGCEVEYGEWGGRPAWRCTHNRHHHRKLLPFHLRLPKMRALISKPELCVLDPTLFD